MSDTRDTSNTEPSMPHKIHFWLGGSLPSTFSRWVQERIRSRWFPLRRIVPVVVVAAMWFAFSLDSGRSPTYLLVVASLPILLAVVAVFALRDRIRRRDLQRYQTPGVDESASEQETRAQATRD